MGDGKFSRTREKVRDGTDEEAHRSSSLYPHRGVETSPDMNFSAAIDRTGKPCYNEGAFLIEEKHMAKKKGAGGKPQAYDRNPLLSRADRRKEEIKKQGTVNMKVKIIPEKRFLAGEFYTGDILDDKIYEVIKISEHGMYNIVDESGDWYSYPPQMFEIVEE